MLHQHHRVIALLDRLAVKVFCQLRQIGAVKINRDRGVLLRTGEFVVNLLLQ
jgi:hypothetical protein